MPFMDNTPADQKFCVTRGRVWRNLIFRLVLGGILVAVLSVRHSDGWIPFVAVLMGILAGGVFALVIKPVGTPIVELGRDGVLLYPAKGAPRFVRWNTLTSVEYRLSESLSDNRHRRPGLVFNTKGLVWFYELPAGASDPETIAAAIRARIPTPTSTGHDTLESADFFEIIFGIRLPDAASTVHSEYHPGDGSGLWAVRLAKADFMKLKADAGSVSEWFPLTRDQRFSVGGRNLVGTVDLQGEYAISRGEWDSTPVLVWDASAGILYGLLTRSLT